jgi:hypothetical protein
VMLQYWEGSVWLIFEMPYPCGTAMLTKSSLAYFSQSQAKSKVVCGQNTKHGTAEPFHFLHMGPMSDVTMLGRLCVSDFGHAMSVWHCYAGETFGAKSKVVCGQNTKHGTAEPFHFLHMGPMSDVTMLGRLCGSDFGHAMSVWH